MKAIKLLLALLVLALLLDSFALYSSMQGAFTPEIIEHSNLNASQVQVLRLTALLHDTGYVNGCAKHGK